MPTKKKIYYSNPGMGDNVMLTAVAHNFYNWYMEKMPIHTTYPELFTDNPYVEIKSVGHSYWDLPKEQQNSLFTFEKCNYGGTRSLDNNCFCDYLLPQNLIFSMCRNFLKPGSLLVTPELFLTPKEKVQGKLFQKDQIVLNYFGKENYKTWDFEKASQLAKYLSSKGFKVLQTGLNGDPLIPETEDLRGKLNLRELAAVLASSRLYIGPFGGVTHLARAALCPGIILFPGAESTKEIQYGYQLLTETDGCTRCQEEKIDPFSACFSDANCTFNITVEQVINAVEEELSHEKQILHPEYIEISSIDHKHTEGFSNEEKIGKSVCAAIKVRNRFNNIQKSAHIFSGIELNVHFRFTQPITPCDNELTFQKGFVYYLYSYSEYDQGRRRIATYDFPNNLNEFLINGCSCKVNGIWLIIPQNNTEIILKYPKIVTQKCYGITIRLLAIPLRKKENYLAENNNFDSVHFLTNGALVKFCCYSTKEGIRRIFLYMKQRLQNMRRGKNG